MMCPEGLDVEATFLDAIGRVQAYSLAGETLELYDSDGELLVRLEPGS